ncbi:hypothetical protein D6783_06155 [Candidatus Woesearchaeota archaeon]|nr:MAG: hypothetical protein D6783_06155 [Candidatus Woesearchaeota archaeon]
MEAYRCEHCGAVVKSEPKVCPLCYAKKGFVKVDVDDPPRDDEFTKKYEEVVEALEKYEEGAPHEKACFGDED